MNQTILIHNPRCSKSREALKILNDLNIKIEIIEYLQGNLEIELIEKLPDLLKLPFHAMLRSKEDKYKELKLENLPPHDKNWAKIIKENPIILERPIFIHKGKAIVARPPELVLELIK